MGSQYMNPFIQVIPNTNEGNLRNLSFPSLPFPFLSIFIFYRYVIIHSFIGFVGKTTTLLVLKSNITVVKNQPIISNYYQVFVTPSYPLYGPTQSVAVNLIQPPHFLQSIQSFSSANIAQNSSNRESSNKEKSYSYEPGVELKLFAVVDSESRFVLYVFGTDDNQFSAIRYGTLQQR